MKEHEELKKGIIEMLMKGDNLDEPYLIIKSKNPRKYSRRELAEAVESETEEGRNFVMGIVKLATELIIREKEKI